MGAPDGRGVTDFRAALDAGGHHEQRNRHTDDVGAFHRGGHQLAATEGDDAVRIGREHMRTELGELARPAQRAVIHLVPEHGVALGRDAERYENRQQINREIRPRSGLHLGQRIAGERCLHLEWAVAPGARPAVLVLDMHAELGEGAVDQREVVGRGVLDHHVAAGDRPQREEGGDFVEILIEAELAAAQRGPADHRDTRGADALDLRAQHLHEAAELLHVRLGSRVVERGRAFGGHRTQHEVLGGGDRGVVQPVLDGIERAVAMDQQRAQRALHLAAKVAEHLHVRVDLAHAQRAALDVVFQPRHAKTRQQRRHQHDGRAHFLGQMVLGRVEMGALVVQREGPALVVPGHVAAQLAVDVENLAYVGDIRHANEFQGLGGEQGGTQDGEYRVLVGGRRDAPAQRLAAVHDQIGHGCVDSLQGGNNEKSGGEIFIRNP
ncbi:hypothetical protein SDC9_68809 [bioreactor metagenome]|uniref:Uncharacterized protein n=1 Tax=bioreactor metagenome TaxID=1076179 RepID=A0A644Y2I6_9ZZZZ